MIKAGDIEGRVEHVGIRSTKIRTPNNSILIAPNVRFITNPIDNFGKRHSRRFREIISIAQDTPPDKVVAFTEAVARLTKESDVIRKDFHIVRLYNLSASIDIMVVLFFMSKDFKGELVAREKFLLDIMTLAKDLDVKLAPSSKILPAPDEAMLMR